MIYKWAFDLGRQILENLEKTYTTDKPDINKISKRFETILLNLRSEALPEKFRRELINIIIEERIEIEIPEVVRMGRPWRVDEFYRFSTQILAGLHDALISWRKEKKKGKENKDKNEIR